jgi:membrane-bound lytic murein transglycosylase B
MRRFSRLVAAALAVAVGSTSLTSGGAAAQSGSAAPPAPTSGSGSATGLANRITDLSTQLSQLEARVQTLNVRLVEAEQRVQQLSERATGTRRDSSELVASTRRQALAAYVFADPAATAATLAAAVSGGDVNERAWSLGLLRTAQAFTMGRMSEADRLSGLADQDLVDAIAARDALVLEIGRVRPTVESARNDLKLAELALDAFVVRLGPSTIAGMTTVAFEAYRRAADVTRLEFPECGIRWELLAAIGKTESNHGAGRIDQTGNTTPPIIGIPIGPDTDGGALDLDAARDHAVGPMQFIPSTWRGSGADGNGDGLNDPNNIWDATLAAGRYLCRAAGSLTLNTRDGLVKAILAYNPNQEYLRVVGGRYEALANDVANGWFSTADLQLPAPILLVPGSDRPPPLPAEAPAPAPKPTEVRTVAIVTPGGLAVASSGAPEPGACIETSAVLSGRSGYVRCQTVPAAGPAEVLDPCQVAPFDPTLVACLPNPQAPARLLRTSAPVPVAVASAGPPYFGLVLDGNDLCRPLPGGVLPLGNAPLGTVGASRLARTETTLDPAASSTDPPTTPPTDPPTTPPTDPPTTPPPTLPPTPPPTDPPTPPPTDPPTTLPTLPPDSTTIPPPPVPPTLPPTIPPAGGPAGATLACASGAFVKGWPDQSGATWFVTVFQPGIADRQVPVLVAYI